MGEVAELVGVSPDTVRRWTDAGELATARNAAGHRQIDGADLAAFLRRRAEPPGLGGASRQSARNRFRGLVTRVEADGVAAVVELQAGPFRLVSLMTAEAVAELGLEPGVVAVAAVKSTSVVVEVPE